MGLQGTHFGEGSRVLQETLLALHPRPQLPPSSPESSPSLSGSSLELSSSGRLPGPSEACSGPAHDQHGTGFSESRQELMVVLAHSYCLGSDPWAAG